MREDVQDAATPPYAVVQIDDVASGRAMRRRVHIVIAHQYINSVESVCADAVNRMRQQGVSHTDAEGRIHHTPTAPDILFVFVFEDVDQVEKVQALARAQWIRDGLTAAAVPPVTHGERMTTEQLDDGVLHISIG